MLSHEVFEAAIDLLAEMTGKGATKNVRKLYYKHLQYAEQFVFREACSYFASRAHWPTIAELCFECNVSAPISRKTREDLQNQAPAPLRTALPPAEDPAATMQGITCFYDEQESAMRMPDDQIISKLARPLVRKLESAGWKIISETATAGKLQKADQRGTHEVWLHRALVYAFR